MSIRHAMFSYVRPNRTLQRALMGAAALAGVGLSSQTQAVPKFESTTLPLEVNNETRKTLSDNPANLPWLTFIAGFTVFQDSEDKNTYYYLPPFRAVPREGGAATAFVNNKQIERSDEVNEISRKMLAIGTTEFTTIQSQYNAVVDRLSKLQPGDEPLRPRLDALRDQLHVELQRVKEQAEKSEDQLPRSIKKAFVQRIGDILALAGFPLSEADLTTLAGNRNALRFPPKSRGRNS